MMIHFSYFGVPLASLTHEKQALELPSGATIDQLMGRI